jgi:hypothetical protein
MERLLARLERKLGPYAISNITVYLIGAMGFAFAICLLKPELYPMMEFDPRFIARQPWRVVTWLAMPPSLNPIWIFFSLSFYYFIGNSLEANWGAFKYNAYIFVGALAAIGASVATGRPTTNIFLLESVLFAVATIAPNFEISFFFFPIRMKWIGLMGAFFMAYQAIAGDTGDRIAVGAGVANYFLFFAGHIADLLRGRRLEVRQAARRASFNPPPKEGAKDPTGRVCAICGAKQDDGADIRVCNCEKCAAASGGKARELCLAHARSH